MSIKPILSRSPAWRGALKIISLLEDAGHQAYIVGGCVRDALLQLRSEGPDGEEWSGFDFDIATSAVPEEVSEIFHSTIPVGAAFGVVIVRLFGFQYEVATFREDLDYEDGRRPAGVLFSTVEEDVRRRDFTINGLFYSPADDVLHDLTGGLADLDSRVIRTIGKPADRFTEDHLRLIRAVRFAARFRFRIEPETMQAVRQLAPLVTSVSAERLRDEVCRILGGPNSDYALELLEECHLAEPLFKLFPVPESALLRFAALRRLPFQSVSTELRPAAFFVFNIVPLEEEKLETGRVRGVLREFRFSNQELSDALTVVSLLFTLQRFDSLREADHIRLLRDPLFAAARELAQQLYRLPLSSVSAEEQRLVERNFFPPPLLTGDDLLNAGLEAGPRFKEILQEVESAQLEGKLTDSGAALKLALQLAAER